MNIYRAFLALIRTNAGQTSLERVLETIGAAISECDGTINRANSTGNTEYIDAVVDDECDVIENLLGAAFVACQANITAVTSHVIRMHMRVISDGHILHSLDDSKAGIMSLGNQIVATSKYSHIQVINAFANYFKHRDEWRGSWQKNLTDPKKKEIEKETLAIIIAVGATQQSTGNMRTGVKALGIYNYKTLTVLYNHIALWADNVATAYESELRRFNLI